MIVLRFIIITYLQCEKCCPGSGKLRGHGGRHRVTPRKRLKSKKIYDKERSRLKRKRLKRKLDDYPYSDLSTTTVKTDPSTTTVKKDF